MTSVKDFKHFNTHIFSPIEMWSELSKVPAVFTLKLPESSISDARMKTIKRTMECEIEGPVGKYDEDKEELVQTLDLLTWLEHKIGSHQNALKLNDRALALTNNEAAFSLGNRAHLMWCQGDLQQAKVCLDSLARLKEGDSQDKQLAAVKASQAYCHFRLGGLENLSQATALYEEALEINEKSCLWMLQAGIVNKRLAHPNIYKGNAPIDSDLLKERNEIAKDYFRHVAQQSLNPRLKAFAYSDLANLAKSSRDAPHIVKWFCEKAMSLCGNECYVILNCGKSLKNVDLDRAIELLTAASKKHPNSSVLKELGNCFWMKHRKVKGGRADYSLRASKCFREAIQLAPLNIPARYSLAKLLYCNGRYEEARLQFGKIISPSISPQSQSYALQLMKAYEQAALCQLELCKDMSYVANLPTPVTELSLRKDAEIMLIKAFEIGFNLCSPEEIKKNLKGSVDFFLQPEYREGDPEALQLFFRLNQLVNGSKSSLEALREFLKHQSQSDDLNAVIIALNSYLNLEAYDLAYALLQTSSAGLGPFAIDENLRRKVTLSAARDVLLRRSADATRIFKAYFDHQRLQNRGQERENLAEVDVSEDAELLDVLLLFDDSYDGATGESYLSSFCRKLQQAMSKVFGLNVSRNMQVCVGLSFSRKIHLILVTVLFCVHICLFIYRSIYQCIYLRSICLHIELFVNVLTRVCLWTICTLSNYLSLYLMSVCLPVSFFFFSTPIFIKHHGDAIYTLQF